MAEYPTLAQQKAARLAAMTRAVRELRADLAEYGRLQGGRFLLYGSAARGDLRLSSDVDLLADFPPEQLCAAWNYAEEACWSRDLSPDIMPLNWCKPDFLERIATDVASLP